MTTYEEINQKEANDDVNVDFSNDVDANIYMQGIVVLYSNHVHFDGRVHHLGIDVYDVNSDNIDMDREVDKDLFVHFDNHVRNVLVLDVLDQGIINNILVVSIDRFLDVLVRMGIIVDDLDAYFFKEDYVEPIKVLTVINDLHLGIY